MGYCKIQNFVIFIAIFFAGCDDGIIALNSQKALKFEFSPKNKSLKLQENVAFGLFFFTKNCGACSEQVKIINEILKSENFKFIAILGDAINYEDATKTAFKKDIKFPLVFDKDSAKFLSNAVGGVLGVPAIYFYDKNGKFSKKFLGLTPKIILQNEIKRIINHTF